MLSRTLALVLLVFSVSALAEAPPAPTPTITPEEAARRDRWFEEYRAREQLLREHSAALRARIDEVKARPTDFPEWAREWCGEYRCGDGTGMNVSILIGPDDELVYTWYGCGGLYDSQIAPVSEKRPDRLLLELEPRADESRNMNFLDNELFLVRWGDRRYAIPKGKMVEFCNRVNQGWEATRPGGFFPLRGERVRRWFDEDEPAPPGLPEVPDFARAMLLPRPVEARAIRVETIETKEGTVPTLRGLSATVTIDAGSSQGLRPCMTLIHRRANGTSDELRLDTVGPTESTGHYSALLWSQTGDFSPDFVKEGMVFRSDGMVRRGS